MTFPGQSHARAPPSRLAGATIPSLARYTPRVPVRHSTHGPPRSHADT